MKLAPLGDKVVLKQLEAQETTKSGILLTSQAKEKPQEAITLGAAGEYGWDGWLGAYMTNDPENELTFLMMNQRMYTGTTLYTRKMRNIVYSSLE